MEEMEGGAGGSMVNLTEHLKELYDRAITGFEKANEALRQWEANHEGISRSDPALLELVKDLTASNQFLKDAERRWNDARAAAEKENESNKKRRLLYVQVAYEDPVPNEYCSVPMDTIPAYQDLRRQFQRPSNEYCRPLYLIYGPRQFGKTTLALRLAEEIQDDPSIELVYYRVDPLDVQSDSSFWGAIGKRIEAQISSSDELINVIIRRGKRLCLILDEMDTMFTNESLTSDFIGIISVWYSSNTFFHGFLGVGSFNLLTLHKRSKGNIPFNLALNVKMEPFSVQQMETFFDQISMSYDFRRSTRVAIMDYSSGAPGVFGSMIRFTIDRSKWMCEVADWNRWFKIQNFKEYLLGYNGTCEGIRCDLDRMGVEDWKALEHVLIYQTARLFSESNALDFGNLLQMGILIEDKSGELCFSSEVMRRICMEAQPIRDIRFS